MVPDKFNMVDMGGIDLIMMQGEEVPGLYDRLVESIAQCRYQCLYNWLFDGVIISPSYVKMEVNEDDEVEINEGVTVSPDDTIHIYSIEPPAPEPEIVPLLAEENGVYYIPEGVDGFNPVTVDVPSYTPVINSLSITENGTYTAPSGVDGYSPVTVDVPSYTPVIQSLSITENGTYTAPSGIDGYSPVTVNVPSGSGIIEEWDFQESFIGKERGIVIASTYVSRDSSGAIFDSVADYLTIPIRIPYCTIELDIGSMNLASGTHRRFVMENDSEGFIYRSNGAWSFYANNSWATDSSITSGSFFENCTLKIVIDSSYYWHIYKDNVLVYEPNRPRALSDVSFKIGSSSNSIYNTVIKELRIL